MSPISHKLWVWLGPGDLPGCGTHLDIAIEEWRSATWVPYMNHKSPEGWLMGCLSLKGIMD